VLEKEPLLCGVSPQARVQPPALPLCTRGASAQPQATALVQHTAGARSGLVGGWRAACVKFKEWNPSELKVKRASEERALRSVSRRLAARALSGNDAPRLVWAGSHNHPPPAQPRAVRLSYEYAAFAREREARLTVAPRPRLSRDMVVRPAQHPGDRRAFRVGRRGPRARIHRPGGLYVAQVRDDTRICWGANTLR